MTESPSRKQQEMREQLAADTDRYLRNGGTIKHYERGECAQTISTLERDWRQAISDKRLSK